MNTQMDIFDIFFNNMLDKTSHDFKTIFNRKIDYPMNIYQTDSSLFMEFAMVNTDLSNIEITTSKSTITIKKQSTNKESKDYLVHGIAQRELNMRFKINDKYDTENMIAKLDKGLLILEVPLSKEAQPKKIQINK